MVSQGKLLGEIQYRSHLQIDKIYSPLSIAIAAVVMRYATPDQHGILRLALPARALILAEVGRLLDETRRQLLPVVLASVQAARDAAQVDVEPVPVPITEQMDEVLTVTRALRTDRETVLDQTGALLLVGIVGKMAASTIARNVKSYWSPWFSQYRDVNGKLLHTERMGAIQHWPGKAGMASAHARTVMLTETTRAHSEAMIRAALRDEAYLKWNLSAGHSGSDACDDKAKADLGYGRGVYPPDQVPPIPSHPRCRCFVYRVTPRERRDAASTVTRPSVESSRT